MNANALGKEKDTLAGDIEESRKKFEKKMRTTVFWYRGLILSSIGLSSGAAIAGFFDLGIVSGIMAVIVASTVTCESSFKFGEKKDFYRILVAECKNLKIALHFQVNTQDKLSVMVEKYKVLVAGAAKGAPRGEGMQAVKRLYEDLDKKGIIPVPELDGSTSGAAPTSG